MNAVMDISTLPVTIQRLFADVDARGGKYTEIQPRVWEVTIPRCFIVASTGERVIRQHRIGSVGWYYRDGRARIGNTIHEVRERLATW